MITKKLRTVNKRIIVYYNIVTEKETMVYGQKKKKQKYATTRIEY